MTETILENARTTPVVGHYDLCVAGGGPAGFATALAAARGGKKVCLLENAGCLGGIWTAGQLAWFIDYKNKTGLIQEIIRKMEERGARGANPDGTPNSAFDVEALKDLLDNGAAGFLEKPHRIAALTRKIREILANSTIFGLDLTTTPLAAKIEGYYARLLEGPGSARRLLQEELPDA